MESQLWQHCPQIQIDLEVVHGEPVFCGTRLPVQAVIDSSVHIVDESVCPRASPGAPSLALLRSVGSH